MSKYVNNITFHEEFDKSKELGYITSELQSIFDQMINQMWSRLAYYKYNQTKHIFIWSVNRKLQKNIPEISGNSPVWSFYDPAKNTNIYAYFTEVLKRLFAATYNDPYIEILYIQEQRKEKLKKINSL